MKKWCSVVLNSLLILATQLTLACPLQKLTYITEDYPPHNFLEDGVLKGVSVDLLLEALKAIKCPIKRSDIKVMPWTRGYSMILNQPNIVLFGMSRIKEREELFKWVGPYMKTSVVLMAKKDSNIQLHNINDLNQFTIGVVKDDVGEKLAVSAGVQPRNFKYGNNHPETLAKMLVLNRFDLWAYEVNVARWMLKKLGYDPKMFQIVYSFDSVQSCYAFSKSTPDSTVNLLQKAINQAMTHVGKSGRTLLDEIYIKYGVID